jgi:hypothetical protein
MRGRQVQTTPLPRSQVRKNTRKRRRTTFPKLSGQEVVGRVRRLSGPCLFVVEQQAVREADNLSEVPGQIVRDRAADNTPPLGGVRPPVRSAREQTDGSGSEDVSVEGRR